ncbi:MAG: PAS domain-containing protein, partial [Hydrogenophaga sp.]|uniref:PAS domain-containing protein n=1 Tax=Hydrogenophaga sp. TaxID=1904254 RepID=UPI002AB8C59C
MQNTPHTDIGPAPASLWWQHLPGLVLVVNEEGRLHHTSTGLVALHAASHSDGDCIVSLTPASKRALFDNLKHRNDFQLELEWEKPPAADARARWFSCSAKWLEDTAQYLCVWVDISASQQARLEACAESGFLRDFCNAIPIMVSHYSYPLRCEYANKHYANQYGLDEQSILGRTVEEVLGNANVEAVPFRKQAFHERKTVTYERSFIHGSQVQWVLVTLVPLLDAQGDYVGAVAMNQDITQRRLAELALRESEDRLAKFMDASAEGVVFHVDSRITDVNPSASRLLEASSGELLGCSVLELVAPEYRARAITVIASGADAAYESEVFNARGERIPVEIIGRSM